MQVIASAIVSVLFSVFWLSSSKLWKNKALLGPVWGSLKSKLKVELPCSPDCISSELCNLPTALNVGVLEAVIITRPPNWPPVEVWLKVALSVMLQVVGLKSSK